MIAAEGGDVARPYLITNLWSLVQLNVFNVNLTLFQPLKMQIQTTFDT